MRTRVLRICGIVALSCHGIAAGDDFMSAAKSRPVVETTELVLAYFGGANCGPCKTPGMKEAVHEAQRIFAARAKESGRHFATMGVAVDSDIKRGLEFLDETGPFDEIIVGKDFTNLAALELMSGNDPGIFVAIPQIVIYERTIGLGTNKLTATRPKIIGRFPGTGIPVWVKAGARTE
jgi:hypothetical protein